MANLSGGERARYVQKMFERIARRYDLMNRLMTFGQDLRWRREVIRCASPPPGGLLLDLGAGTGDLARQALQQQPSCRSIAADFTLAMMRIGQAKRQTLQPAWVGADALRLPFTDAAFDAVVSGFLFRNLADIQQALQEQWRVLKPGGRIVILDTTRPPVTPFTPLVKLHLNFIIPTLGKWITGEGEAYRYLPQSTLVFLTAEQLAERMRQAGFRQVSFRRRMLATIAIHWGVK